MKNNYGKRLLLTGTAPVVAMTLMYSVALARDVINL